MPVTHPLADRDAPTPGAVTGPDGTTYSVDSDGVVDCPDDVATALRDAWADHYDATPAVADPPLNPADFAVEELREALAEGDYEAAELDAIADAEGAGKERTTAFEAIDAARED